MKSEIFKINNIITNLKTEHWNYRLVALGVFVLIILVSMNLLFKVYDAAKLLVVTQQEVAKITTLQREAAQRNNYVATQNATQWNIFGSANAPSVVSSKYDIIGIQYSPDDAKAKVLISTDSKDAEIYHVGDQLTQGIIIQTINPDNVILLRNGIPEKLTLSWDDDDNAATTPAMPTPPKFGPPNQKNYNPTQMQLIRDLRMKNL